MFDVDKNDLTLLTMEYEENQVKKIIAEAVKGNIELYFQYLKTNSFKCLLSWQVERIRQQYPNKTSITLEKPKYLPVESCSRIERKVSCSQILGVNDLWINKKEVAAFIAKLEEMSGTKVDSEKLNRNIENKMLGIGRDELSYLIKKYEEKHVNKILYAAMEGKIKLYVLHTLADIILPISPEKIEVMVINYPEAVEIELEASDKYFNPHRVRQWSGDLIVKKPFRFSVDDLLINKKEADIFIKDLKIITEDKQIDDNKSFTPLITLTNKAIKEFWINHDPRRPPKKEAIKKWLVQQGVAERVAEAIDTIIRPKIYKKGGNKSQTKGATLGQKK